MSDERFCCPDCQAELSHPAPGHWRCESCAKDFTKVAYCNQCHEPLEVLKACGAVNYFCNHCNELKSKKSAEYRFIAA